MCFNPFSGSRWPFIGCAPETKKSKLQDRAEDISFEEVKESTKEETKIDEDARARQISKAVQERMSDLLKKHPISGVLAMSMFLSGAYWADNHPLPSYKSRADWMKAQYDEVQRLVNKASISKDYLFEAILFATFADGAMWANDNPAPTL